MLLFKINVHSFKTESIFDGKNVITNYDIVF